MYVTTREAARILGTLGLRRGAASRVLATGLAGEPMRTAAATLYERARVEALTTRRLVEPSRDALPPLCRGGVLVARISPSPDPLESARGPARMSLATSALLAYLTAQQGSVPLVVTVSHFVVAAAEVVGSHPEPGWATTGSPRPRRTLDLQPAGAWFDVFRNGLFYTPPGNPWLIWGCPLLTTTGGAAWDVTGPAAGRH